MSSHTPRVVRETALDWVKFDAALARDGSVDPVDKALYAALSTFVNKNTRSSSEDPEGDDVPTRKVLAACIGRDVRAVDRSTARLEASGLIKVERRRDPDSPRLNLPSIYHLLDHHRWDARAAERHANRRGANRTNTEGGGVTGVATPGVTDDATPSGTDDARGSDTSDAVPSSLQKSSSSARAHEAERSAVAEALTEEEEERHDYEQTPPAGDTAAHPAAPADDVMAFVTGLPRGGEIRRSEAVRIAELIAGALAAGWKLPRLREYLARKCGERVKQPGALYIRLLEDIPAAPAGAPSDASIPAGRCPEHPGTRLIDGECVLCDNRRSKVPAPQSGMDLVRASIAARQAAHAVGPVA